MFLHCQEEWWGGGEVIAASRQRGRFPAEMIHDLCCSLLMPQHPRQPSIGVMPRRC
jgi:hypothetical protein